MDATHQEASPPRTSKAERESRSGAQDSRSSRPKRACRQANDELVQSEAVEDVADGKKQIDQRTLKIKERNKRAQQKFRERQREKSRQTASQVEKLQKKIVDLTQQLAAAANSRRGSAGHSMVERRVTWERDSESGPLEPYLGWTSLSDQLTSMKLHSGKQFSRQEVVDMSLAEHMDTREELVDGIKQALSLTAEYNKAAIRHLQGMTNEFFAWYAWGMRIAPARIADMLRQTLPVSKKSLQALSNLLREKGITAAQVQQLAEARKFCLSTLAQLVQERRELCDRLQAILDGHDSWETMRTTHASTVHLQQLLNKNVSAEAQALFTFTNSALRRVLNPIQTACVIIHSHPSLPLLISLVPYLLEGQVKAVAADLLFMKRLPSTHSEQSTEEVLSHEHSSFGQYSPHQWNDIYLQ